jgi:serine/threonine-protein kinase
MDSARWELVQALFHQVADLPAVEQRQALALACAGDAALLAEVMELLQADAGADSLLDRDVARIAHDMIGAGPPLPTQPFGPYRVIRMLGEGGMGVVYLGQRDDLGSVAAIKILRDAWLSPARRERFASEQRTLAQLNHPAIARLLDADSLPDGTPWFVMEYVAGESLTEHCAKRAASLDERLRLFREVCVAVQHAHHHAVIHRDLKPSNIMVAEDGSIKLLDFGIAKQLESLEVAPDQTRSGMRLMTPAYAAPEQLRGEPIGVHTDVYSLGVVLYELLTGILPFDLSRRTPSEADAVIVAQDAERPSSVVRRMPVRPPHLAGLGRSAWADLDVLCLTAMQKDPQRRYASVGALIRDLDHYRNGEPLEARPDSVGYRMAKFARRNTRALVAAGAVLLLVVSLVGVDAVRLTRARNLAVAEAARAARVERFMLNLFEGGDPSAGPADSLRVTTLLDRGVREARSLSTDPAVQTELYLTLGGIYQKLGAFDRADTLVQLAIAGRRRRLGPADPDVGAALVTLGLLRIDQARYDEAEKLIREGIAIERPTLPADHPEIARASLALGRALQERGEYADAVPPLEEAIRLQRARAGTIATSDLAEAMEELANTRFQAGEYDASDSLNRLVLVMNRSIHGDHHPTVADILINLGAIQFQRGNYVEAERFDREALAIDLQWYGPEHYETASAMTLVGRALVYQQRFAEAVTILRQSLAIQERVNGPVHPRVASALNDLGLAATKGGQLDEAEADFRRMDAIYAKVYGDHHYLIAIARSNLATVFLERKEYPRAEAMYRDVVARFTDTQGPTHLNTAIARIKLGRSILRQGRFQEAEKESSAGYELLKQQTAPGVSWLQAARTDLAAIYDSLREPEKAARIRQEIAEADRKSLSPPKGN